MKKLSLALIAVLALTRPVLAESEAFFTLKSTEFVVTLAFIVFIGALLYFNVPGLLLGLLDKRAAGIKADLAEARALRDEAQKLLASYDRKQRDVQEQSARIVAQAEEEAKAAGAKARQDLAASIARRVKAAEDQIASAEAAAVREVRDRAVSVAVAAAGDLIARGMTAEDGNALIEASIAEVEARMH